MKIREEVEREVKRLGPVGLAKVYELIRSLKDDTSNGPRSNRPPYLETREALASCSGSLSDDISLQRDDRV